MGNTATKLNSTTACDGGGLVPNGIYSDETQDFDTKAVQRLIFARQMAPFYLGADDPEEDTAAAATATATEAGACDAGGKANNDDGWWSYNLLVAQRESSEPVLDGASGGGVHSAQMSSAASSTDEAVGQAVLLQPQQQLPPPPPPPPPPAAGHARKGSGLFRRLKGSPSQNQHSQTQLSGDSRPVSGRSQSTPLGQHERSLSDAALQPASSSSAAAAGVVPPSADFWRQLLRRHIECPICFLYYPKNINYTRCCHKPLCTECFVQIKRKIEDDHIEPTHCPYCVEPNLGIVYYPPTLPVPTAAAAGARTKHRKQKLSSQLSQSSISSAKADALPSPSSSSAAGQQHARSATTVAQPLPAALSESGRTRSHSSASTMGSHQRQGVGHANTTGAANTNSSGGGRLEPTIVMSDDIRPSLSKDLAAQLESKRKRQLRSAENMAMIAAATRRMSARQQHNNQHYTLSRVPSSVSGAGAIDDDDLPLVGNSSTRASSSTRTRLFDRHAGNSRGNPTSSAAAASASRASILGSGGGGGRSRGYESEYSRLYREMRAAGHTDLEEYMVQRAIRMSLCEEEQQQQQQQEQPQQETRHSEETQSAVNVDTSREATLPSAVEHPLANDVSEESGNGEPEQSSGDGVEEETSRGNGPEEETANEQTGPAETMTSSHESDETATLPFASDSSSADIATVTAADAATQQPQLAPLSSRENLPPPPPPPRHDLSLATPASSTTTTTITTSATNDPIVFDSSELDAIANVSSIRRRADTDSTARRRAKPPPPPLPPRLHTIQHLTTPTIVNGHHGRSISGGIIDTTSSSLVRDLLDLSEDDNKETQASSLSLHQQQQQLPPPLPLRRRPSLPHASDAAQLGTTNPFYSMPGTATQQQQQPGSPSADSAAGGRRRRQPPPPPVPPRNTSGQPKTAQRERSDSASSNQQPLISL
ncbi:SNF1-interacting protein [Coemansia sp. RSA 1939]|nr:SNF1-interacting protein [Coemansia sp. RSA 1939]